MKLVALTRGLFAKVDDKNFDRINAHKWHAWKGTKDNTFYAKRRTPELKDVTMHEEIIGKAPPGFVTDHRDRDGLNNQEDNLRFITRPQNRKNGRPMAGSRTGFKGVYETGRRYRLANGQFKNYLYFSSWFEHEGKRFHVGSFKTAEEAAKAYDEVVTKVFGEYAYLNFPQILKHPTQNTETQKHICPR